MLGESGYYIFSSTYCVKEINLPVKKVESIVISETTLLGDVEIVSLGEEVLLGYQDDILEYQIDPWESFRKFGLFFEAPYETMGAKQRGKIPVNALIPVRIPSSLYDQVISGKYPIQDNREPQMPIELSTYKALLEESKRRLRERLRRLKVPISTQPYYVSPSLIEEYDEEEFEEAKEAILAGEEKVTKKIISRNKRVAEEIDEILRSLE